jgi:hypothetical protein
MDQVTVGIITTGRKYLYISLGTYGFNCINIFAEPNSNISIDKLHQYKHPSTDSIDLTINRTNLGIVKNWYYSVLSLIDIAKRDNSNHIMICEDDALLLSNFNTILQQGIEQHPNKVLSGYIAKLNAEHTQGWHVINTKRYGWLGSLCMIYPVKELLEIFSDPETVSKFTNPVDYHLDTLIGSLSPIIAYHPSLVRHIGVESTFGDLPFDLSSRQGYVCSTEGRRVTTIADDYSRRIRKQNKLS